MNDDDRGLLRELFAKSKQPDPEGDLANLIKEHGADAVKAAVAKSLPDAPVAPAADPDDPLADLTDADLAALGLVRASAPAPVAAPAAPATDAVAKATDERLTRIETAIAKMAGIDPTADPKAPADVIALVKQGVPPALMEEANAKAMLAHSDPAVRAAMTATLLKQANPALKALLAKEEGSAKVPEPDKDADTEKARIHAHLAKAAGETNGTDDITKKVLAQIALAAGGN